MMRVRCWLLSAFLLFGNPGLAANFSLLPDSGGRAIVLYGTIEADDADALRYHHANSGGKLQFVVLESGGGDLVGGMKLAFVIDEMGLSTVVPPGGNCHSACSVVFMGGVRRLAGSTANISVHAPYRSIDSGAFIDPNDMMQREITNLRFRKTITDLARRKGISETIVQWMFASRTPMFSKRIDIATGRDMGYITEVFQ